MKKQAHLVEEITQQQFAAMQARYEEDRRKNLDEIRRLENELSRLQPKAPKKPKRPSPLKNPNFNELVEMVIQCTQNPSGDIDEDKNSVWECAVEAVYGPDIWKWWNG